tara:strand:- start:2874 stop:3341 length:468 start_codon:yes stop_codon:yes gene_type:complete
MTQYNFESVFAANAKFLSGLNVDSSANVKEVFEKVSFKDKVLYQDCKININDGSLHFFDKESKGNFTFNLIGLNNLPNQRSVVITILCTMGTSAYVLSNPSTTGFKIDNTPTTVKWISSSPPTSGFVNSINSYTFAIIKDSKGKYTVLGTLSRFG